MRIEVGGRDDYITKPTHPVALSCNACMRIAERRGIRIGYSVRLPNFTDAQVVSINHLFGQPAILVDDGRENYMISLKAVRSLG